MTLRTQSLVCLCLVTAMAYAQSRMVDRVVAVVGNRVITQSDWDEQQRYEALVNGKPASSRDTSSASLDRLIDQMLMQEQIKDVNSAAVPIEQVKQQVLEVRKQISHANTAVEWRATLASYSLAESDFERHVAEQLSLLRFVELRFRPSVQVNPEQIEAYYNDTFISELRKTKTDNPSLPQLKDVQEQIRRILTEQKVNELLQSWIEGLRVQGRIKRMVPVEKEAKSPSD